MAFSDRNNITLIYAKITLKNAISSTESNEIQYFLTEEIKNKFYSSLVFSYSSTKCYQM